MDSLSRKMKWRQKENPERFPSGFFLALFCGHTHHYSSEWKEAAQAYSVKDVKLSSREDNGGWGWEGGMARKKEKLKKKTKTLYINAKTICQFDFDSAHPR